MIKSSPDRSKNHLGTYVRSIPHDAHIEMTVVEDEGLLRRLGKFVEKTKFDDKLTVILVRE